ncbi:MAG: J domain-containing protein [Candidatus Humimicrobiaceae bacterium]
MKKLITFKDIENARKVLGLSDIASIEDIKDNHRKLILEYHPDRHNNSKDKQIYEEKIKDVNSAYKIIMDYSTKYPISFREDKVKDVEEGEYAEDHFKRFYDGW